MALICEKKKFGTYSCLTNVFIELDHFMKKEWKQLKTKQLKQNIFKSMGIYGFSKTDIIFMIIQVILSDTEIL